MKRVSIEDLEQAEDNIREHMAKRVNNIRATKPKAAAVNVKAGSGKVVEAVVLSTFKSAKPSAPLNVTVVLLGEKDKQEKGNVVSVPYQRSQNERYMPGGNAMPNRPPIEIEVGTTFTGSSFDAAKNTAIQPYTQVLLTGVSYSVAHHTGKEVKDSQLQEGDAYLEIRIQDISDVRPLTDAQFLHLTSVCVAQPVNKCLFGIRVPYPDDVPRVEITVPGKSDKEPPKFKGYVMEHWNVPNDVLLSHSRSHPSTVLHIRNHLKVYLDQYPNLPGEYMNPGPPVVVSQVPLVDNMKILTKDHGLIAGIAEPDAFKSFRMTTADPTQPQGDFYAQFRELHVSALGIGNKASSASLWVAYGQLIVSALDMIVVFNANVVDSGFTPIEGEEDCYLQRGLMGVIKFFADTTFSWIGPRVSFGILKEAMLTVSYPKEDISTKSIVNPKMDPACTSDQSRDVTSGASSIVKVICLNEYRGDINVFDGSNGLSWRFYMIPVLNTVFEDPSIITDIKKILTVFNFKDMNEKGLGDVFYKEKWADNGLVRNQLGFFAVRD